MQNATSSTLIKNGKLIDGTGTDVVVDAALLINNGKISYAGPAADCPQNDAKTIDACGGTIMPGLVEAHYHATYFNVAELTDLDIKYPVEYVSLLAAANAITPEAA